MNGRIETVVFRRVYDDATYLIVGQSGDNPDWIELCTEEGPESEGYYGKLNVVFPVEYAIELGKALIAAGEGAKK